MTTRTTKMSSDQKRRIEVEVVEDAIGHLFRWSGELTEMGYQGSTEADDENEYVLSCIQRLADAFDINLDELGYGGEEEEE